MPHPHTPAQPHLAALSDRLVTVGAIRTPPWAEAFAAVPRHHFVPTWFARETDERGLTLWRQQRASDDPAQLAAAYRDATLVTALDPATAERADDTAWTGVPTSSSTRPSLLAGMLEELTVRSGHRVLEVGTGTGYQTALLCARLGEHLVYSVDIDPDLVLAAQRRLEEIGYVPQLVPADGRERYPTGDSFDRIIATCSVPATGFPAAWAEQTVPGGVIVADVDLGLEGGIVRLTVDDDHRATGHFAPTAGRFMPARGDARTYPPAQPRVPAPKAGTRPTALTAAAIRTHHPLRLLLAAHLPGAELAYHMDELTHTTSLQLQHTDGSWARVQLTGGHNGLVTYGGDPDLWQHAESAWRWWKANGRPAHHTFGYTREPDGSASVWHRPTGTRWALPNCLDPQSS